MLDRILLFPYSITLALRNAMYNRGFILKSRPSEVPTISIGNVTAGGTGKTPHTEMILRELLSTDEWGGAELSVLSRGYRRKTKGFQVLPLGGSAAMFGDESAQIKGKFPAVTVAVDKSRLEGCDFLAHPEKLSQTGAGAGCQDKDYAPSQLILLDDAFQYRKLAPDCNVVLVDFNRPPREDSLIPLGRLRDLPGRIHDADILIVTKCPSFLEEYEMSDWARKLGLSDYDPSTCHARTKKGKDIFLFFTFINHEGATAVFPDSGDTRYIYSRKLILVTGIARNTPLRRYLADTYKIVQSFDFPDHHRYSSGDISAVMKAVKSNPTAVVMTTEKDAARLRDLPDLPATLRQRLFQVPIKVRFLSEEQRSLFISALLDIIREKRGSRFQ